MAISRSEGMNLFYADWGPDFVLCPTWASEYLIWMLTPSELQVPATRKMYAEEHKIPIGWLTSAEEDRQFIAFRKAVEKEAGFTEAHLYEVRRNLYRLASQSNDVRAIKLFLDLMGEGPRVETKSNVIDVDEITDERLNEMLVSQGLDALPPAPTDPEEG